MIKAILLLIVLITSSTSFAKKMNVRSYVQTEFDSMFEIKVLEYPKVILDCQSFFNQLVIYNENKREIYHLSSNECYNSHIFLYESQQKKKSVCLSLDKDLRQIDLSNKGPLDCK